MKYFIQRFFRIYKCTFCFDHTYDFVYISRMKKMREFTSGDAAELPQQSEMVCVYFSRPDCGVCDALRPRVEALLEGYNGVDSWFVDLEQHPEAAGHYTVFTIPAVILFVQGKETVRFARHFSIDQLEEKLSRYYKLLQPAEPKA